MIYYLQKLFIYSTQYGLKRVVAESWIKSKGLNADTNLVPHDVFITNSIACSNPINLISMYLFKYYLYCLL